MGFLPDMSGFSFHKVDGSYEVSWYGIYLGDVYRDPDAWFNSAWFIVGQRRKITNGGNYGYIKKACGFARRADAARELAVMKSGLLVRAATQPAPLKRTRSSRPKTDGARKANLP